MVDIKEILSKADEAQAIAEVHGKKVMSFEDYRNVATQENMAEMMGQKTDLGGIDLNPDGSLARTKCNMVAVNLENFYDNRFKKVKNKYYVVIDHRVIDDVQENRAIPSQIQGYLISGNEGEVVCEKMVTISDKDFISDFTHKLDNESMRKVLDAISRIGGDAGTEKLEF